MMEIRSMSRGATGRPQPPRPDRTLRSPRRVRLRMQADARRSPHQDRKPCDQVRRRPARQRWADRPRAESATAHARLVRRPRAHGRPEAVPARRVARGSGCCAFRCGHRRRTPTQSGGWAPCGVSCWTGCSSSDVGIWCRCWPRTPITTTCTVRTAPWDRCRHLGPSNRLLSCRLAGLCGEIDSVD
jgi:hypothetical protein